MHVVTHHTVEQFQQLQRKADRPSMVLKFQAIVLARNDWMAREIAEALGKSTRTIQQWVGDYNRQGLEGLADRRGGNHRYLNAQQEQQLKDRLDAAAEDPNDGVRHVAELAPWIEEHFGVSYSPSGLYDLLHRLGYEWLVPRPRHIKNDPAVIEAFKKTPLRWWHKSKPNTLTVRSRCGSKTKPALVSRAH